MEVKEDETKWQSLWDGPDTIESQTKIVEWLEKCRAYPDIPSHRKHAQDYLADLVASRPVQMSPLQIAIQRVDRLKIYNAPHSWVKRAVELICPIEKQEMETKWARDELNMKWSELWHAPDTEENLTKIFEFVRNPEKRKQVQTCLDDLVNGRPQTQTALQAAEHRVWRLKAYKAPQSMVKRAVEERIELVKKQWSDLLRGPDTYETQKQVVAWLKAVSHGSRDYYQAKARLRILRNTPSHTCNEAAQAVRRLKAHDAPQEWIDQATNAFLKFKFH